MKKRILTVLLTTFLLASNLVKADEGMWLPFLLGRNYEDMKKMGLNLTEEEIYSINNSSLKDAIVSFGGFCTAEVISQKGLLLTNHHCGYEAIADASSEENNYLDDGFWASSHSKEIPVEDLTATFVVSIADVTEDVTKNLTDDMTEDERAKKIEEIYEILAAEATEGTEYKAYVRDFFEGNEFYLFVTETYEDVRFTGAPPQSIGKFGYDTDNWMYPRHTGDFSLFRVYAGPDNKPAAYSEENKPLKPKHSLPISIRGYEEGDFAMVFGFPGSTDRYLSSFGVEQAMNIEQPKRVEVRKKKLDIMRKYMDESTQVRLNYSSKYAQVANYWKYFIGQTKQLKENKVADKKRKIEAQFNAFASGNPAYEGLFEKVKAAYDVKENYVYTDVYQSEFIYSVDLNLNVFRFKFVTEAFENEQEARGNMIYGYLKNTLMEFYETANMDLEFEILEEVLKMYYEDLPEDQKPEIVNKFGKKGKIQKLVKKARKKSIFSSKEAFEKFDEDFSVEEIKNDPLYELIVSIADLNQSLSSTMEQVQARNDLKKANRLFVKGYREMEPTKKFYPNANSTLRLTYGKVLPYTTNEGTTYGINTYLSGVMEKEDPDNREFNVPKKLKELYEAKDYGNYADDEGRMPVNFISNNDITGGNSGSPVINGDGHLIGTAFDGNWEAMSGDIFFEKDIQRTISCDIRYVLFTIDKYGGASNIIDELEIIK